MQSFEELSNKITANNNKIVLYYPQSLDNLNSAPMLNWAYYTTKEGLKLFNEDITYERIEDTGDIDIDNTNIVIFYDEKSKKALLNFASKNNFRLVAYPGLEIQVLEKINK